MASKHFFPLINPASPLTVNVKEIKPTKISIVGAGQVGMAATFSILLKGICNELAIIDLDKKRVTGEMKDLQQCQQFIPNCTIIAGSEMELSKDSDIIVLTAGVRQQEGESRLNLVQRNLDIFKKLVPDLVKYSPNTLFVVVSNPVDIMSYVTWKISGLPRYRVFGTGTMLDTARFRGMIGHKLGISPTSVHGYIIGEHGDTSVAVFSSINIAGVSMKKWFPKMGEPNDPDKFDELHKDVVNSAYEIIKLKGYTSWAIGVTIMTLCASLLKDDKHVYPLSVLAKHDNSMKDLQGIDKDVYLSLPCVVSRRGVSHVIPLTLDESEKEKLYASAKTMNEVISGLKW